MRPTRLLVLAAFVLAILVLGACGGGSDKENAESTVKDIAKATSDSNGEDFCGLITKQLQEQLTGSKGDKAEEACKKLIDSQKSRAVKVTKITKTEVKDDKATVTAELESQGQKRPQVFELKKEDGKYRLASANQ
ncbi:MAG: DUF4878 domain-containing protein [Thermoleophilaceae bacterium]|nr:DUF4878 domain-containing protein [Thermoleophilaceae bacterium]